MRRDDEIGPWMGFAVVVLKPLLTVLTARDWRGGENLPRTGGVVVAVNHISYVDPLSFAHFVWDNGRAPRFLAKSGLFRVPFVRQVLRGARQIPVYRDSADASRSYSAAVDAVRRGECVCFYPEGTLTRDPQLWPMVGRSGAARVALETGVPVVPVAQWGAQEILAPYTRRVRLLPRRTMHVVAGPPVDLSDLEGLELDAEVLRRATERIMQAVTELLVQIRGGTPPAVRFDPRADGDATGDSRRAEREEGS